MIPDSIYDRADRAARLARNTAAEHAASAYHNELALDADGAPEPGPLSPAAQRRADIGLAEHHVDVEARSVASWRAAYVSARAAIGAANHRASVLARIGWDIHAMRRQYAGEAMREMNRIRRGLRTAEWSLAAALAALSALSLPQAA